METKEKLGASCAEPGCAWPSFFFNFFTEVKNMAVPFDFPKFLWKAVKSIMSVGFFQVVLCNRLEQNATQSEFRFWQSSEQHVRQQIILLCKIIITIIMIMVIIISSILLSEEFVFSKDTRLQWELRHIQEAELVRA